MAKDCRSTLLIDSDGTFNVSGLESFTQSVKLVDFIVSYAVIAVMGPQITGKITLLNSLFHTNFGEMSRTRTMTGIRLAEAVDFDPFTIVLDLEGNGGQDQVFEKHIMFALALADIVLINTWCNDIARDNGATVNKRLVRTVFEVVFQLFPRRKSTLLFVLRDKNKRTPIEQLEVSLKDDLQKIWDEIPKPDKHKNADLSDFFTVQISALCNYESREEFKEQVAQLRRRIYNSIAPGGLASDRQGVVPGSAFSYNAQTIWQLIRDNKDLRLPAHKVTVNSFTCDAVATQMSSNFCQDEAWLELKVAAESGPLPNFGKKLTSIMKTYLSMYDKEAMYFEEAIRDSVRCVRKQLESNLLQLVRPTYNAVLDNLLSQATERFQTQLDEALKRGEGFAASVRDCKKSCMLEFDIQCAGAELQKEIDWDTSIVREKLKRDIAEISSSLRIDRMNEIVARYERKLSSILEGGGTVSSLVAGKSGYWASIRTLLKRHTNVVVSEFRVSIAGFELDESTCEYMLQSLNDYATSLVLEKARKMAKRAPLYMRERFSRSFDYDEDFILRRWNGNDDIEKITLNARNGSLKILAVIAAARLDEMPDNIEKTLFSSLMDHPRVGSSCGGDKRDSEDLLASNVWDEVSLAHTIITPVECKSIWREFLSATEEYITQANSAKMMSIAEGGNDSDFGCGKMSKTEDVENSSTDSDFGGYDRLELMIAKSKQDAIGGDSVSVGLHRRRLWSVPILRRRCLHHRSNEWAAVYKLVPPRAVRPNLNVNFAFIRTNRSVEDLLAKGGHYGPRPIMLLKKRRSKSMLEIRVSALQRITEIRCLQNYPRGVPLHNRLDKSGYTFESIYRKLDKASIDVSSETHRHKRCSETSMAKTALPSTTDQITKVAPVSEVEIHDISIACSNIGASHEGKSIPIPQNSSDSNKIESVINDENTVEKEDDPSDLEIEGQTPPEINREVSAVHPADTDAPSSENQDFKKDFEPARKEMLFHFFGGYEFEKDMLIRLWVAFDLFTDEDMEENGAEYFEKLVSEGYILCTVANSLYKVNTEKLNSAEFSRIKSEQKYAILDNGSRNDDTLTEKTLHMSVTCDDIEETVCKTVRRFKQLKTLLILGDYVSTLQRLPVDLFVRHSSLVALDLSGTHIKKLPTYAEEMIHLRYLDLSWTFIELLTEKILRFTELQTLKLKGCSRLRRLPEEMKRLIKLRHLDLDVLEQLVCFPKGLGTLEKLRTLSAFPVGTVEGLKVTELQKLNKLTGEFCIAKLENVQSVNEAKEASLVKKTHIKKLKLRWSDHRSKKPDSDQDELILESLCPHTKLEEIHIVCYHGTILPSWIGDESFTQLFSITLFRCKYVSVLPYLGKLPSLEALELISLNSVAKLEYKREGKRAAFPKLQKLVVDEMLNVETWEEDPKGGDYPCLIKLDIKDCPKLSEIPILPYLPSIQHFEVSGCDNLAFVSEKKLPSSLQQLIVEDCPLIEKKCSKETGEDWYKIQNVPTIWIDQVPIKTPK